jgi:hypothetical protein
MYHQTLAHSKITFKVWNIQCEKCYQIISKFSKETGKIFEIRHENYNISTLKDRRNTFDLLHKFDLLSVNQLAANNKLTVSGKCINENIQSNF